MLKVWDSIAFWWVLGGPGEFGASWSAVTCLVECWENYIKTTIKNPSFKYFLNSLPNKRMN